MVGEFLCKMGLHRYEWASVVSKQRWYLDTLEYELRDKYRCRRPTCWKHFQWYTANVEQRRLPW